MSIQEIMSLGGSKISANVNFEDLKAFADYLIQKTKEEVEESILAKKKETFVKPKDACKQLQVDQVRDRRLARAGTADKRDLLSRLRIQGNMLQNRMTRHIAKRHIL